MALLSRKIYRTIFEALCFVSLLSLFEFILFYVIIAPLNEKKTTNIIIRNLKKLVTTVDVPDKFDVSIPKFILSDIGNKLTSGFDPNLNHAFTSNGAPSSYMIELKKVITHRFQAIGSLFGLIDQEFAYENTMKLYLTIVIILSIFLLAIIWFIFGYYVYGYKLARRSFLISIPITFVFTGAGQIFFAMYIIPRFQLANNATMEGKMFQLLKNASF